MAQRGEVIEIDGQEYIVVFDGTQSLIRADVEGFKNSSLTNTCRDPSAGVGRSWRGQWSRTLQRTAVEMGVAK